MEEVDDDDDDDDEGRAWETAERRGSLARGKAVGPQNAAFGSIELGTEPAIVASVSVGRSC